MIYLAALAAAIAFVYAGILYVVSPANPGKIQEAHKIFWTVLWGLVITLAAWIIVNTVLVTLNGQNIADGTQILCAQPDPQKIVELCEKSVDWGEGGGTDEDGGGGGGGGTIGKFGEADKEVVAEFRQKGVEVTAGDAECQKPRKEITVDYCVHSSTKKFTCDEPGCTKLAGMQPTTKALLVEIAKACRANNDGKPCGIVITGGTEGKDHADGTYSHAKGYKFDVRDATAQRVGSALARLREEGLLVDAGNDTLKTTPKFKNLLGLKEEEDYCLVPRKETKHVDYAFRPC
ncbi:MAG: hypothetical protein KatS3mg099_077 [Candidatus Parcubacteria bacterium]|nr:MAG: hypothetical protein KatS3mg099_077 [Candidatus Parcubacteria bacterium]